MNKLTQKQQGFTIIEVVLVLAIAALILLMVFIAWPALQRNQRDTARKNDAQTVASAVGTYKGNNQGSLTGLDSTALGKYVSSLSQYDVSTVGITAATANAPSNPTTDQMVVYLGHDCPANLASQSLTTTPTYPKNSRAAAVMVQLEGGGGVLFCVAG